MDERDQTRRGMRSVGAALPKLTGKYAGRRAPLAQLRAVWPDIAGRDIAAQSLPEKLLGLARGGGQAERPAGLRIRCAGVAALELQHRQSELIGRINAFFGYRAIDRIALVQGPLPAPASTRTPAPPLAPAMRETMRQRAEAVADPDLRAALRRLADAIAKGG